MTAGPFTPFPLGPVTLRNRIVKAATFEGPNRGNVVDDRLVEFHRTVAAGGVGMTTLAYCAISEDGQGAPGEIVVRPDARPGLEKLVDAVHAEGAAASIQIGHAGPVAAGTGRPGLAPSRIFAPQALRFTTAATTADLARVVEDFGRAAAVAVDAGFDAIELHFGHGYLVSSFLSPRLNRRRDEWGGPVGDRARLARRVAERVREIVGDRVALLAKLNMADGVPRGLWLDESVEVGRLLERDGTLDALELTGGSSFQNPMYLFRGEAPVEEMAAAFPPYLRTGFRLTASRFMPAYPFEEAYFLPYARQFREALSMPLILLGGVNRLDTVQRALDDGFELVAMGRALLREPDLPARWAAGDDAESRCVHCNKCMPTIYSGTRCVLVEPAPTPTEVEPAPRPTSRVGLDGRTGRLVTRVTATPTFARLAPRAIVPLDLLVHRLTGGRRIAGEGMLPTLVLHTTGARTGERRSSPLGCLPEPDGSAFFVVGSNFGRERHPAWTANLLAHPEATVSYGGAELPVRATLLDGTDKQDAWARLLEIWPNYDVYAARAGRELRVFRLERVGADTR